MAADITNITKENLMMGYAGWSAFFKDKDKNSDASGLVNDSHIEDKLNNSELLSNEYKNINPNDIEYSQRPL